MSTHPQRRGTTGRLSRARTERTLVPSLVAVAAVVAIISSLGAPLIPSIATANHVALSTAEWILTIALLTGALATPVMGRLADGPRQRAVILVALSVVLAGSVLAAVSTTFQQLVIGRGMQGVGLGLLPVTMAVARSHLPVRSATRAIATLSVTGAIGVGLGYPITSVIAERSGYQASFWFGAAMVFAAMAIVVVFVPRPPATPSRRFDLLGAVALSVFVVGFVVVLSEGDAWGWSSTKVLATLVACALLLAGWILHERRVESPLVDLGQVRIRSVLMADVAGFLISLSMYLFLPVIVEFVQIPTTSGYGFGVSILVSGLLLVPLSVGTFAASRCLGAFTRRFGIRPMIPFGSLLFAAASLFFALAHKELWQAFVSVGVAGLGVGFTFAAMPGFIVRAVPRDETGSATGFYQLLRSLGLSVGSALAAAVLAAFTHPGRLLPTVGGFQVALLIASALCLLTAALSYVLSGTTTADRGRRDLARDGDIEELMEESAELGGSALSFGEGTSSDERGDAEVRAP